MRYAKRNKQWQIASTEYAVGGASSSSQKDTGDESLPLRILRDALQQEVNEAKEKEYDKLEVLGAKIPVGCIGFWGTILLLIKIGHF